MTERYSLYTVRMIIICALIMVTGCFGMFPATMQPVGGYSDPLAGIVTQKADSIYSSFSLGYIESENYRKSMALGQKGHMMAQKSYRYDPYGAAATDPNYIPDNINKILKSRFNDVIKADTVEEAVKRGADIIMVMDAQIEIGMRSGKNIRVYLGGIFIKPDGTVIEKVEGEGIVVIPFPATATVARTAMNKALKLFAEDLDNADMLKDELNRRVEKENIAHKAVVTYSRNESDLSVGTIPEGIGFGNFHALIIGVNEYKSLPKLKTAVNDAREIGRVLREEYGYRVKLLLNATRADILKTMSRFRNSLTVRDNLLIYYAGHGWLDKEADQGYWLPVDATRDDEINWISNTYITSAVKAIRAKHVLIVADSCYSGKLTRGLHIVRRTPDYFSRIAGKRARQVLSSGGLEPVADTGSGNHSVFAAAFIEALKENKGIIDGTGLFSMIRRPVMVNSDQTPEYADIRKAGHDGGDFLFVKTNKRPKENHGNTEKEE